MIRAAALSIFAIVVNEVDVRLIECELARAIGTNLPVVMSPDGCTSRAHLIYGR